MSQIESADRPEPGASALLTEAITHLPSAVMITDVAGRIAWVNDAFCTMCGYGRDELIGSMPSVLKSGRQSAEFYASLWQSVLSGKVWQGSLVEVRKDRSLYVAEESIAPLRDADGEIRHFVAVQHDITRHEQRDAQARFLALHDALTGLPNRRLLHEVLAKAIAGASRSSHLLAVMFVDLDCFKPVNDTYGHDTGDHLLAAVAERLQNALRQSDTVARVGGDEFIALAEGLHQRDGAAGLAKKLVDSLAAPFAMRGTRLHVGVSVGIAIFPDDGRDSDTLVAHADQAMYRAKRDGGNRYRFFEQDMAG